MAASHQFQSDAETRAKDAAASLAEKASDFAGRASAKIDRAVESAEQTAHSIANQTREAGESVQEVAGNVKVAIDRSVKEQPMATLAVAAALGFVIGAIWKS
jgi:ElaB/YqjD/DUF883 family membrane-anchored ribosome-binding protein